MTATELLDRPLPRWLVAAFLAGCLAVPTAYFIRQAERRADLSPVICYGAYFAPRQLPEIRAMHPATGSYQGFDGQFYVQMALDPTLRRPDLPAATDGLAYRGQRIFLPALAWLLGAGQPRAIVVAYALLNLGFWYALVALMARRLTPATPRRLLALGAIVWSTGTLISVEYALTDLPSTVLGLAALELAELPAAALLACAILTKPTAALFLVGRFVPWPADRATLGRKIGGASLALLVPALWYLYLRHLFHDAVLGKGQFTWPLAGWGGQLTGAVGQMIHGAGGDAIGQAANVLEVLALISVAVQAAFLAARPKWRDPVWAVGAAFAVLLLFLDRDNYQTVANYARSTFPMTVAFNLLLLEGRPGAGFLALFVAGNLGLIGGLGEMLLVSWR